MRQKSREVRNKADLQGSIMYELKEITQLYSYRGPLCQELHVQEKKNAAESLWLHTNFVAITFRWMKNLPASGSLVNILWALFILCFT